MALAEGGTGSPPQWGSGAMPVPMSGGQKPEKRKGLIRPEDVKTWPAQAIKLPAPEAK